MQSEETMKLFFVRFQGLQVLLGQFHQELPVLTIPINSV